MAAEVQVAPSPNSSVAGDQVKHGLSLTNLSAVNRVNTPSTPSNLEKPGKYRVVTCRSVAKKLPALLPWPPIDSQSSRVVVEGSPGSRLHASNVGVSGPPMAQSDVDRSPGARGGVAVQQSNLFLRRLADTLGRLDNPSDEDENMLCIDEDIPSVKIEHNEEQLVMHEEISDQPEIEISTTDEPVTEGESSNSNADSVHLAPVPSRSDSRSLPVKSNMPSSCSALQSLKSIPPKSESLPMKPVWLPCLPMCSTSSDPARADEGYLSGTPHSSDTNLLKQLPFSNFLESFSVSDLKNERKYAGNCMMALNSCSTNKSVIAREIKVETNNVVEEEILVESKDFEGDSSGDVHVLMLKNGDILESSHLDVQEPHIRGVENLKIKSEPDNQFQVNHSSTSMHPCMYRHHFFSFRSLLLLPPKVLHSMEKVDRNSLPTIYRYKG